MRGPVQGRRNTRPRNYSMLNARKTSARRSIREGRSPFCGKESQTMFKKTLGVFGAIAALVMLWAAISGYGVRRATAEAEINSEPLETETAAVTDGGFSVEILINGVPASEYAARGRRYIEAFENAENELRIRNPSASRVAVALAVDSLHTSG